jgi:hypothetical protein
MKGKDRKTPEKIFILELVCPFCRQNAVSCLLPRSALNIIVNFSSCSVAAFLETLKMDKHTR